ncbi:hypothetical protein NLI96_g2351 [Meripilus lineatus]|uniref:Uncharacterized protein n=1 Tax=Meripilus lineatus TaxID=2056292 RepID=A0AAD5VB44_9APHY|nr:hypothetical protein NLI96_g2351 [Physisporinus lineatus]
MSTPPSNPPFLIHTPQLTPSEPTMTHRTHPLDSSRARFQSPIGDLTGLSKTGVHFCTVPPHTTSTSLHWHSHEDEWFYIIDAAEDCVLLFHEPQSESAEGKGLLDPTLSSEDKKGISIQEVKLSKGDFIGFAAGMPRAHALRSGSGPLVYLLGGSREPLDVSHYPELGLRRVMSQNAPHWVVEEKDIQPPNRP